MSAPTVPGTAATTRTALTAAARRRGAAAVTGWMRRGALVAGVWFWGFYAVYAVALILGNVLAGNDLETSALDVTLGAQRWAVVWIGVVAATALLPVHVAAGGDRRSLAAGVVRGALLVGGAYGVLVVLALLGERLLSTSLGMTWSRLGALPFGTPLAVLGTAVAEALVITTYILVGASVGAGFMRARAWGTLLMIPLLVPAALVDLATRTGVVGTVANVELRPDLDHAVVLAADGLDTTLLGVGGAALAALLAAAALHALLRTAPVRPR